jgi:hypothetical protein
MIALVVLLAAMVVVATYEGHKRAKELHRLLDNSIALRHMKEDDYIELFHYSVECTTLLKINGLSPPPTPSHIVKVS